MKKIILQKLQELYDMPKGTSKQIQREILKRQETLINKAKWNQ